MRRIPKRQCPIFRTRRLSQQARRSKMAELKQKEIREQLRGMSDDELHTEIAAQREALYNFRRRHALKQVENTAAIRDARRQIARALTLLRERELAAQKGTA